jgi:hypothetical protein
MKRRTFQVTVDTTVRSKIEIEAQSEEEAEDAAFGELGAFDKIVKQVIYDIEEVTAYR